MNIVGIQESFIDYPDHICIIVFTKTCKWSCPHCHNKSNLLKSKVLPEKYVLDYINESKPLTNRITISGGEPTDDPDVFNFIKKLKDLGLKVKLDTTGYNPSVLKKVLPYLSVVAMDVKEVPDSYKKYKRITDCTEEQFKSVQESLELLSEWSKSKDHYLILRTTLFDNKIVSDDIKACLDRCLYHYDKYVVQKDLL